MGEFDDRAGDRRHRLDTAGGQSAGRRPAVSADEAQVTLVNEIRNSMATELVAINAYAAQQQAIAKAGLFAAQNNPIFQAQGNQQLMQLAKSAISFDNQINGKNVWWDLQLVPLTDLQFSTDYNIVTTALLPPMTIDLSLPGTPP